MHSNGVCAASILFQRPFEPLIYCKYTLDESMIEVLYSQMAVAAGAIGHLGHCPTCKSQRKVKNFNDKNYDEIRK